MTTRLHCVSKKKACAEKTPHAGQALRAPLCPSPRALVSRFPRGQNANTARSQAKNSPTPYLLHVKQPKKPQGRKPTLNTREAASQVRDEEIRALMDSLPEPVKEKQVAAGQKEVGEEDPMQRLQRTTEELGARKRRRAQDDEQSRNHAVSRTDMPGRNTGDPAIHQ